MDRNRNVLMVVAVFALAGMSVATHVFVAHSLGDELFCVSLLGVLGFAAYLGVALIGCVPTRLRAGISTRSWS